MSQRAPNLLYILSDDWGYGDLSCLNPESKIPTPYADAIAARGMTFTDAHSNSAVCTPTRYGIMTGRYCWRSRLKAGVLQGFDRTLLEPERLTVARFLKAQGYRTACIGKWHLGLDWGLKPGAPEEPAKGRWDRWEVDFTQPVRGGPHTAGFDYSYVLPASLDMAPYCYVENGRVTEPVSAWTQHSPRPAFWRGGPMARGFQHETTLLEFTKRAEQFLAAQTGSEEPFFLYLPLPSPHTPHVPRKPFVGSSRAGVYGDFVVEHDWSIGQVWNALQRSGHAENTLFIVTSDNGAHCASSATGQEGFHFEQEYGHRSNYIYRGQKSDAWDGGHRIPFLAVWPDVIQASSTCNQTICLTDLLATCADLHQTELPADAGEDSASFLPLLRGEAIQTREATVHHSVNGQFAIRQGRWKFIECAGSGGWSLPDKQAPEDAPPQQFYDMEADPSEQVNLFETQRAEAKRLQALLDQYRAQPRSC
jgi:arylsulfatase A